MFEEHPLFKSPEKIDAKIWRYMDFTKFVSVLDRRSLFFARADCLSDPWEGATSKANHRMRPSVYKDVIAQRAEVIKNTGLPEQDLLKIMEDLNRSMKGRTFINSWHLNEVESAAMWKLYQNGGDGIAIQSTFERLRRSLSPDPEPKIHVGLVNYVDYDSEWLPEGNLLYPFVHKRRSFEHEREVRAVFQVLGADVWEPSPVQGVSVQVDLTILAQAIYVAPTAQVWVRDLVASVADRYGLRVNIIRSNIAEDPVY